MPHFHSVEGVFSGITPLIATEFSVESVEFPYAGGVTSVIRNLWGFRKEGGALYHLTGQEYYMALVTGRNTVLTIHDIGSALTGNGFKRWLITLFWFWIPALLVRRITVISENSAEEVRRLLPFARRKIIVIPNPVSPLFTYTPKSFEVDNPLILLVGTRPNKNLERTLEALQGIACRLLIIGSLSAQQVQLLSTLNISYRNVQNLTTEEVAAAFQECDLVSFASTYEGFGMPIVEAQAVGRPVLTSALSSMPEVAGGAAHLVDPYSVTSIREGLLRIISDADYRQRLVEMGLQNVERFTPEKIAAQYIALYHEIC